MIKGFLYRTKYAKICVTGIALLVLSIQSAKAQSLQFSMQVQPEVDIEVLQNLNFGTIISNSGTQQVQLGDMQMGIFKIKALAGQTALLTLEKPEYLSTYGDEGTNQIPIRLDAAYSNKPYEYSTTRPFSENNLWVSLSPDNPTASSATWQNGYVFIFGAITVGEVPQGSYSGKLVLNVVYQ